jgi:hypothetical protein
MMEKNEIQNNEELKNRFIQERASGKSFKEIATALNLPVETLIAWAKTLKYDIGNQKAIELDELSNKFRITKRRRIELIGSILTKMQDELDTRDYKDVPTDKLFDYLLKYSAELNKEYAPPVFTEIISGMNPSVWETEVTWTG